MSAESSKKPWHDYSLVGPESVLAVEKGLADARWYASPVTKHQMRELLKRRDGPAIRDTLLWFALLLIFGYLGFRLWGTWWAIIPFAVYGILYGTVSDSRWHESSHGTAFKTDWMNNALYEIASFMIMRESVIWRWSHTRHHSDTIIVGRDPEIAVPRPADLLDVFSKFFNLKVYVNYTRSVIRHCFGKFSPEEMTFTPDTERGRIRLRAWIYVAIYASVIALSIYTRSFLPLMFVGLANLYGSWLTVTYGLTQHAGLAENVLDHRLNCRTVYMNFINRYLYWNMGYHVEHHMFPLVPYHALPKLHAIIKADIPPAYPGLLSAYREIIPVLRRQSQDPTYYVRRPLPPPMPQPEEEPRVINGTGRPVEDGWVEIGPNSLLESEDVLRFDYQNQTYAIYRTADNRLYASDGACTHGNAHLADGMVKGTIIECAKHNGRYDIRDGSPQRLPVCVGLKTYQVREQNGRLLLNLLSAGGYGVTAAPIVHRFRVVSNANLTPLIKELVLEYEDGAEVLDYQPGDYLQFDIPAFPERSLAEIEVQPPYHAVWTAQKLFDLRMVNPAPTRRSYSLATNPVLDTRFSFNVRLTLPPHGQDLPVGVGSAYLFGLKPGDPLTAIGPFGQFHIKESEREIVYLGGGSGMAPLKAHISYLLETRRVSTPLSYWFGARNRNELFYIDYFEALAQKYPNFRFHTALSEPLPADDWTGSTGFIHEVLRREYLAAHPDPTLIDYYLCGPTVMIHAAEKMLADLGVPPAQIIFDEF